jgi:hypothetical protein
VSANSIRQIRDMFDGLVWTSGALYQRFHGSIPVLGNTSTLGALGGGASPLGCCRQTDKGMMHWGRYRAIDLTHTPAFERYLPHIPYVAPATPFHTPLYPPPSASLTVKANTPSRCSPPSDGCAGLGRSHQPTFDTLLTHIRAHRRCVPQHPFTAPGRGFGVHQLSNGRRAG